jgi:hypothetical protein
MDAGFEVFLEGLEGSSDDPGSRAAAAFRKIAGDFESQMDQIDAGVATLRARLGGIEGRVSVFEQKAAN